MNILNNEQIKNLRFSGKILKESMDLALANLRVGVTGLEIDDIVERHLLKNGCSPSFKNYFVAGVGKFPSTICFSVNNEIVHGIPTNKKIKDGDVVSLDIGAGYKGIFTDMARTVQVGKQDEKTQALLKTTKESLDLGIKEAVSGNTIGDIGHVIQRCLEASGFGVIREYVGHGIGIKPHLPPQIPNFGDAGTGDEILEGMALAIEPMSAIGDWRTKVSSDGWTVLTRDDSLSAHFEDTIIIIDGKPEIVTR